MYKQRRINKHTATIRKAKGLYTGATMQTYRGGGGGGNGNIKKLKKAAIKNNKIIKIIIIL